MHVSFPLKEMQTIRLENGKYFSFYLNSPQETKMHSVMFSEPGKIDAILMADAGSIETQLFSRDEWYAN
jgi:hypothetical protein